ncbi:annexin D4 [Apium graveolens]|uniref:annexin D4 n=1 Tax=Apium graveolens TaxID=4045 RepID=UPI003D7B8207
MTNTDEQLGVLTKAFSGIGVDEKTLISVLGNSHPDDRKSYRKGIQFFTEDERSFERWQADHVAQLEREFLRFKNAMVFWAMHPWERDARLVKNALLKEPQLYSVVVEIACTRSSEELLGARKAYHSLYDHSIEEDVAVMVPGPERKLLGALVSAYRYEGSKVNEETAKSEAKIFCNAIKDASKNPVEDEEVIRILTTRSKLHISTVFKHYKEICGNSIDEDLDTDLFLKETVQCLCTPETYFSKTLDGAFNGEADEDTKDALTRVIVTQVDTNMQKIKEDYHNKYGVQISDKIAEEVNGNYKDFLLTLLSRES